VYTFLGGLTSAIYNEVLQFFLIVAGFVPLVFLGLRDVGGWNGIKSKLDPNMMHSWAYMGTTTANPMGVEWFGIVFGLGFVMSFGYWCTNFLVVQRAMAADSMSAARRTPLIGAIPKMFLPILVILPGMIAMALTSHGGGLSGFQIPTAPDGTLDYNNTIPMMLGHYLPTGVLGLGLTALMASFMSGMAGNVTAFNTVWTYDIYQSYIRPGQSDKHYLKMGQMSTVFGILISMAAAFVAAKFNNIMDFLQLIFAFVNAPLFATFLLGMFWKRATGNAAFVGLLAGTTGAALHHGLTQPAGATTLIKGGWLHIVHVYSSEMAQNFWTAIVAFGFCFVVTIVLSLLTKSNKTDEELKGLVYSLTPRIKEDKSVAWYASPATLGVIVCVVAIVLNIIFW
jgi:SSS family solute:Na+ symporter